MYLTERVSGSISHDLADKLLFYFFLSSIDLSGSRKSAGLRRILGGLQSTASKRQAGRCFGGCGQVKAE